MARDRHALRSRSVRGSAAPVVTQREDRGSDRRHPAGRRSQVLGAALVATALLASVSPPGAPTRARASEPAGEAPPARPSSTITDGEITVGISDLGLLTSLSAEGLRTVDGPIVRLGDGFREAFGLAFETPLGHREIFGSSDGTDWGDRVPVRRVSFEAGPASARAVTRAGAIEIVHEFAFDPDGPYLLASVTVTNHGPTAIRDVFYTREWTGPRIEGFTFPDDLAPRLREAPEYVARSACMFDDLLPGRSAGMRFSYTPKRTERAPSRGVDVPLSLWTNGTWPSGVPVGATNGISFGDYDADGFIDFFACESGNLWRNVGGVDWELAENLDDDLPFTGRRYGASFGDYDNDGLPDIGTEPREGFGGDECFHLLRNLGGSNFVDVATDPAILDDQPCMADAETICWADVDFDADLDMVLPVYPAWAADPGPGNSFLHNLGPTGPGGAYRFSEQVEEAGLDNPPPASARPEGAQFLDTDEDGDLDFYCNGHLYQNRSTFDDPTFEFMTEAGSGIGLSTSLDEGAMFFDYDLDGDQDLFVVYTSAGVVVWESYGDGNFFRGESGIIESPFIGLNLGMSAEDWDNDGDIDFTTRQVFRRNMLVEEGSRRFAVATTSIPGSHITSATPSWGDWNKDGDLDCALGNWLSIGHFYENTIYDDATPAEERRHVRVRVVRDDASFDAGLETEFGAIVEIAAEDDSFRRRKFTTSASGYLNQNEYTLHFALPPDPAPEDPDRDVVFDVSVDFPNDPAIGLWRVDRHVNPVLGNIDLAGLDDREIKVYRSGRVVIDGCDVTPEPARSPVLEATTDGLARPTPTTPLPAPVASLPDFWYGIDFHTDAATEPLLVKEIRIDGQLGAVVDCGGEPIDVALWDVTTSGSPVRVENASFDATTSPRNRRTSIRAFAVLQPDRRYRLVARLDEFRATPISAPVVNGPVTVLGGLAFVDASPCDGTAVDGATRNRNQVYLSLRFASPVGGAWTDLGQGLGGAGGIPTFELEGEPVAGEEVTLRLSGARADARAILVIGREPGCLPAFGGRVVPDPFRLRKGLRTDASGNLELTGRWPASQEPGTPIFVQMLVKDPTAPDRFALSNAVAGLGLPDGIGGASPGSR